MLLNSIFSDPITAQQLLICLAAALILGVGNSFVFLFRSRHTSGFALTLALMPMAVAVVIMLVNGNIGTGVAIAGAFTLTRFRSVPGTAREISAIFVDMGIGLALGMGYIGFAILFFLVAAVFVMAMTLMGFGNTSRRDKQMKITIPEDYDYSGLFDDVFDRYNVKAELQKVKTASMGTLFELTYDVQFPDEHIPKAMIDDIRSRNGNLNIVVGDVPDSDML